MVRSNAKKARDREAVEAALEKFGLPKGSPIPKEVVEPTPPLELSTPEPKKLPNPKTPKPSNPKTPKQDIHVTKKPDPSTASQWVQGGMAHRPEHEKNKGGRPVTYKDSTRLNLLLPTHIVKAIKTLSIDTGLTPGLIVDMMVSSWIEDPYSVNCPNEETMLPLQEIWVGKK